MKQKTDSLWVFERLVALNTGLHTAKFPMESELAHSLVVAISDYRTKVRRNFNRGQSKNSGK